jgi:hypothetical protein
VTVVARRVVSSPVRTATKTWSVISNILAPKDGAARTELSKVAGVACSLIASEAPTDDAIVIWGNGPRVRIYCLFGDGAISGEDRNEDALASCPTENNWSMSFPCLAEDLAWVQKELAAQSKRISARKLGDSVPEEEPQQDQAYKSNSENAVNEDAFFRP